MDLSQYFLELRQKLKHLSESEIDEAIEFYSEYAAEAGIDCYEAMVNRFGSPRKLASAIYAETATKEVQGSETHKEGNVSRGFWIGMAALVSFPFSFSATIALFCIAFAFIISVGSILFSFIAAAFSIAAAGVWSLIQGFISIYPFNIGAFLMHLGSFMFLTPVGCILLVLLFKLVKIIMTAIITSITNYIQRRTNHEA